MTTEGETFAGTHVTLTEPYWFCSRRGTTERELKTIKACRPFFYEKVVNWPQV